MAKSTSVILPVSVEALIPQIVANHRECMKLGREAANHAIEAGELLLKMKDECKHGEFVEAIEARFDFSPDTAQLYMKLATHLPGVIKKLGKDFDPSGLTIRGGLKLIESNAPPKISKKPSVSGFSPLSANSAKSSPRSADTVNSSAPLSAEAPESPASTSQESAPTGDCPRGGGHEFDEEGDCKKCKEPNWGKDQPAHVPAPAAPVFAHDDSGFGTDDADFDPPAIEAAPRNAPDVKELAEPYRRACNDLNRIRREMRTLADSELTGQFLRDKITRIERAVDEAKNPIWMAMPHSLCGKCGGKKCKDCSNTGWWPRSVAESRGVKA